MFYTQSPLPRTKHDLLGTIHKNIAKHDFHGKIQKDIHKNNGTIQKPIFLWLISVELSMEIMLCYQLGVGALWFEDGCPVQEEGAWSMAYT